MSDVIVKMLGSFSIARGDSSVDDSSNRMRKVWLLLAYLIYSRGNRVTQDSLLSLMQNNGSDESADPNGRLKAMLFRARSMLNQIDGTAGRELILHRNGNYQWNTEIPLRLDIEEFESLCKVAAANPNEEEQLSVYLQAAQLYRGDFLPKLSMEAWVMPIATYYHQMYLDCAEQALLLLEKRSRWSDAATLCQAALKIEPYSESLYRHLMRSQLAQGDRSGALRSYEEMSDQLFSTFGVMPSDESRQLYRDAARESDSVTVPVGTVRDQLREPSAAKGALYCEYDFFRLLYQVQARAIIRTGDTIHIAMLSLHGYRGKELARRSLDRVMDNLQELVISNLRQGDVVTRCSVSQLIIMLPQANYENSCMVCDRIVSAFGRKYPHSPAQIHYSVQPLEPTEPAAFRAAPTP